MTSKDTSDGNQHNFEAQPSSIAVRIMKAPCSVLARRRTTVTGTSRGIPQANAAIILQVRTQPLLSTSEAITR
jgi:hypothetical protein